MPTLQSALPPELADNVIRLYRECLRRARFVGHQGKQSINDRIWLQQLEELVSGWMSANAMFQCVNDDYNFPFNSSNCPIKLGSNQQHNTALVVDMVRQQFRKHMHETDPDKIQMLKDDAARGLINHILYESEKITGKKLSGPK